MSNRHQNKPITESSITQSKDPLHGLTLETILIRLVDMYGYSELHRLISIKCFENNASLKSSLTFLRRTPWAREKVEALYVQFGAADWIDHLREKC